MNKYDQANIETMELLYGQGYLSMGGDAEVARIVSRLSVQGSRLLDVGCGMGGAAITLVKDQGADTVTGVDIDAGLLVRAQTLVESVGLENQIELIQVNPGPLPFTSTSFDHVYLTAVSCHVESLGPFMQEMYRIVRPGGCVVGGEWFIQRENKAYHRWNEMLRTRGLNFYFVTRAQMIAALENSGFIDVEFIDQSSRTAELAAGYLQCSRDELRTVLIERMGEDGYAAHLEWTQVRAEGLAQRGSGYGHFVARRPIN